MFSGLGLVSFGRSLMIDFWMADRVFFSSISNMLTVLSTSGRNLPSERILVPGAFAESLGQ